MNSFAPGFLESQAPSHRLVRTIRELGEYKARQEYREVRSYDILDVLRRAAQLESVRSSNRIEGIVVPDRRIQALMEWSERGDTRPEREIAGYHRALKGIRQERLGPELSPAHVLFLWGDLADRPAFYRLHGDRFRSTDDVTLEAPFAGSRVARLAPAPAAEVPQAMEELHRRFEARLQEEVFEPLLLIATYILDFVLIQPFPTGNGRMARLLTHLLLQREGYDVGWYVSLERVVEDRLEGYRDAFSESAPGWHHSLHDLLPWWEHFLGEMLLTAYRELEVWADRTPNVSGYFSEVVDATIERCLPTRFRVADLERACPGISRTTLNRVLRRLRTQGRIELVRAGRGAIWEKREVAPLTGG